MIREGRITLAILPMLIPNISDDVDREPTVADFDERVFREYRATLQVSAASSRIRYRPTKHISQHGAIGASMKASEAFTPSEQARRRRSPEMMVGSRVPTGVDFRAATRYHQTHISRRERPLSSSRDYRKMPTPSNMSGAVIQPSGRRDPSFSFSLIQLFASGNSSMTRPIHVDEEFDRKRSTSMTGVWMSTERISNGLSEFSRPCHLATSKLPPPLDPVSQQWPVFPTFDQRTLAKLVREDLADRGLKREEIHKRRNAHARDLLLAIEEDIRPLSLMTHGARNILKRVTTNTEIGIGHLKHEYLAPHGGRRGIGEDLVRRSGIQSPLGILTTLRDGSRALLPY